ncbi:MAG: elongation factor Ts [Bacteroidetes bacterium]|nr:elongation factor Ts [Bacteroidota bacterium]
MSTVTITAADINKLRQMTGAGMMDCRKALIETQGNMDAAVDWLRKKGQKVAALRGDRDAKEGVILARTSADNRWGIALCISCETDFVSKNADFVAFAQRIMEAAIAHNVQSAEVLNAVEVSGVKIADLVNDKLASIGEKIGITKFERIDAEFVASYVHGANRMGVLVGLNLPEAEAGKDVAMQIAAMNPVAVDASSVAEDVVSREKAIIIDQIRNDPKMAGKPEEMINKIADGKLNAFFKESTLLAQAFVKDGGVTVGDHLKTVNKDLKVLSFRRIALG